MENYKAGGEKGNSNLFATNRLFKQSPLFRKRKKKAPGIYNPKAKYIFDEGGALLTKKVTCKKCGWEWDAADGGNDITTCHKCGGQGLVHAQKGGGLNEYKGGGPIDCGEGYEWNEELQECVEYTSKYNQQSLAKHLAEKKIYEDALKEIEAGTAEYAILEEAYNAKVKKLEKEKARVLKVRGNVIPASQNLDVADSKINTQDPLYQNFLNASNPKELELARKALPQEIKNLLPNQGSYNVAKWNSKTNDWKDGSHPGRELYCTPYGCFAYQKAGASDVPIIGGNIDFANRASTGNFAFEKINPNERQLGDIALMVENAPNDYTDRNSGVSRRPHHTTIYAGPDTNAPKDSEKGYFYNADDGVRLNFKKSYLATDETPGDRFDYYRYVGAQNKINDEILNLAKQKEEFNIKQEQRKNNVALPSMATLEPKLITQNNTATLQYPKKEEILKPKNKKLFKKKSFKYGGLNKFEEEGMILDLSPEEIKQYTERGYVIEDISVPSLSHMADGGSPYYSYGNKKYIKKNDGTWFVESNGEYVPITENVKARTAELNKNAKYNSGTIKPNHKNNFFITESGRSLPIYDAQGKYASPEARLYIEEKVNKNIIDENLKTNYHDGAINMVYPEVLAIGPGGGLLNQGLKTGVGAIEKIAAKEIPGLFGTNVGQALGAGFAADAVVNRLPQIPGQVAKGEYLDAGINAATGVLDLTGLGLSKNLISEGITGGKKIINSIPETVMGSNYVSGFNKIKPGINKFGQNKILLDKALVKTAGQLPESVVTQRVNSFTNPIKRKQTIETTEALRKQLKEDLYRINKLKKENPGIDLENPSLTGYHFNKNNIKKIPDFLKGIEQNKKSTKSFANYFEKQYADKMALINKGDDVFQNIAKESPQYIDEIAAHLKNPAKSNEDFLNDLVIQSNTYARFQKNSPVSNSLMGKSIGRKGYTMDVEGVAPGDYYGTQGFKIQPTGDRVWDILNTPLAEKWSKRIPEFKSDMVLHSDGMHHGFNKDYQNFLDKRLDRLDANMGQTQSVKDTGWSEFQSWGGDRNNINFQTEALIPDNITNSKYFREPRHLVFESPTFNAPLENFSSKYMGRLEKLKGTKDFDYSRFFEGTGKGFKYGGGLNKFLDGGEPCPEGFERDLITGECIVLPERTQDVQEVRTNQYSPYVAAYEQANPRDAYVYQKKADYLNKYKGLNRQAGLSQDNFNTDVEGNFNKNWEYDKNSEVIKQFAKDNNINPKNHVELVEKMADKGNVSREMIANSKYGSKLQPSLWARSLAGAQELGNAIVKLLPGEQGDVFNKQTAGLTKKEWDEIHNSSTGALETFAVTDLPGAVIANSIADLSTASGGNFQESPGLLSGELKSNVDPTKAALLNPFLYAGIGQGLASAPKIAEGVADLYKGAKNLYKGASNYGNDIIQTSKQAGKFELPKYSSAYRVEHAGFNTPSSADDLTGRWFARNPKDVQFYADKLKDPKTGEIIPLGQESPVRIMRKRLPEYKIKEQFGAGMPEEARTMSMGRGDFTNAGLDDLLGPGAGDRFTQGKFINSDYNAMESAPFLFRQEEGILDANRVNQLRSGTNQGRFSSGNTTILDNQVDAINHLKKEQKLINNQSRIKKFLPFKEGGYIIEELDTYDDSENMEKNMSKLEIKKLIAKGYVIEEI